jgi:alpha-glucosidase (family GH31 glycosyl hydrolase)
MNQQNNEMITEGRETAAPGALAGWRQAGNAFTFESTTSQTLRLDVLADGLTRVRLAPAAAFAESLAVRCGFVRDDWSATAVSVTEDAQAIHIRTTAWTIRVERASLRLAWLDHAGRPILREHAPAAPTPGRGPRLAFDMAGDERFYGFGFQRLALDARGRRLLWARRFRHKEATVPFFMSTRGYGFYSNNTWEHTFDFTGADTFTVQADGGQLDYYVIHGPTFREILAGYTDLTGRTMLAPRWALGLLYICRYFEGQDGVLAVADRFRADDFPCDMIGLEPGWEDIPYEMAWRWSKERFPDPPGLVADLAARGFVLELWESGDAPKDGYADPAARRAWYAQRVPASLDIGVRFFKQDDPYPRGIISEELQAPQLGEPLAASGELRREEMYNLSNTLYSETAMAEYRRITGERTLLIFNGYNASVASHRWPAAWAADYEAGCGMLSAGLSGHGMVSFDMRSNTLAGIHYGYLVPFAILDAWAYYREPWLWPEHMQECHRLYAKLRHRLAPYLYTSLWQANQSGVPMMRAMALDYGADPNTADLTSQYMLGDWLLVGLQERVYLPAGEWVDFWTGRRIVSAGEWAACPFDEPAGGPLLVKVGALIPTKPVSAYLEEEPAELVILDAYPATERSSAALYEDDGRTFAHESGAFATTTFGCQQVGDTVAIAIGERRGDYAGQPDRAYLLSVHVGARPREVRCDGAPLPGHAERASLLHDGAARGWWHDDAAGVTWIKLDAGWRFGPDRRGAADPEADTLVWTTGDRPSGAGYEIVLQLSTDQPTAEYRALPPDPRLLTPAPCPLLPDRLHVVANPPERIALKWGDWLPHKTNLYVSLCAGERTARGATGVVRMEALDGRGRVIRQAEQIAQRGRAEFLGEEYVPGETVFRFTSPGLAPSEVTIRPAPAVPGRMFGPPAT